MDICHLITRRLQDVEFFPSEAFSSTCQYLKPDTFKIFKCLDVMNRLMAVISPVWKPKCLLVLKVIFYSPAIFLLLFIIVVVCFLVLRQGPFLSSLTPNTPKMRRAQQVTSHPQGQFTVSFHTFFSSLSCSQISSPYVG
jgi:hypothetical protein